MNALIVGLKQYAGKVDEKRLRKAYELITRYHAEQKRKSGDPYITHLLAVADLLLQFEADEDTIIAALLHDIVEDTEMPLADIEAEFGRPVARLVDGVTKIATSKVPEQRQRDKLKSLQKMFEIMQSDIRTILIKLCDRLHNMQTLEALTQEKRERVARETLEIYVPLTERLSLDALRYGLLQACYQVLFPEAWNVFQSTQQQNAALAQEMTAKIKSDLKAAELEFLRVEMLPKIYDITAEKSENLTALEVADTHLIQVIVPSEKLCYEVVFLLHKIYSGQPNSFRDYITSPKANGYQALHTKVIDRDGNIMQLRILTPEMEQVANRGVTLYWHGRKESLEPKHLNKLPLRFKWLEDLGLFSREQKHSFQDMEDYLRQDFLSRRILVRDKKGNEFDLPQGATALDFIYTYFSEQAKYTRDISVNKQEAFSHTVLMGGDKVEFMTDVSPQVEASWLQAIKTYAARKNIQADLEHLPMNRKVSTGQILLQEEFDAENKGLFTNYPQKRWAEVARSLGEDSLKALLLKIGAGQIPALQVFRTFFASVPSGERVQLRVCIVFLTEVSAAWKFLADQLATYKLNLERSTVRQGKIGAKFYLDLEAQDGNTMEKFLRQVRSAPMVQSVRLAISITKKLILVFLWIIVLTTYAGSIWFLIHSLPQIMQGITSNILPAVPLIILLVGNAISSGILRNYIKTLRLEKIFIGTNMLLNTTSMLITLAVFSHFRISYDILILFAFFFLSILFSARRYNKTSLEVGLFEPLTDDAIVDRPIGEMRRAWKEKLWGYVLRFVAVFLWSTTPLVARYSLPEISGVVLTALSLSAAFLFLLPFLIYRLFKYSFPQQQKRNNKSLLTIVVCDGLFLLFYFLSVKFTSASDTVLFINFAPVIALLFGLLFMKVEVPYLQNAHSLRNIVGAFIVGTAGTSLLVLNSNIGLAPGEEYLRLIGNIFAVGAVIFDVIATVALIKYTKSATAITGLSYILVKIGLLFLLFLPFSLYAFWQYSFSAQELLILAYSGVFGIALAWYLSYEAYKRLDGFVNYLLMNLVPVLTIFLETIFFDLPLTYLFLLGALFIVASSIAAEYISTHQKPTPVS